MTKLRLCLPVIIGAAATVCFAQPNRILTRIDNTRKVILAGHVHPSANAANDIGGVESSFALPFITLQLKPTAEQQADLEQLLQDQQNPSSASFHQWLTPEQYAERFGVSTSDLAQIVNWLESQGFTVNPLARSRTFLTFSGNASQVEATFGAAIHRYRVNGVLHFANAGDPKVPAALAPMVAGFRGLTDFHPKSRAHVQPRWTNAPDSLSTYSISPDDFATIYDVTPMYTAGITGAGETIAIVGQSALYNSGADVTNFWNKFGISAKLTTKLVPRTSNPGVVAGGVDEGSLDTEWAGAVARGATIQYVYSSDAWVSAQYIVDQNLAPVMSMSLGLCEAMEGLPQLPLDRQVVLQANAQGITWLAAAGDAGSADCDGNVTTAEAGLTVDAPGSIPEITSMGGTQLNTTARYWNTSNTSTGESAKGYVPETVWNDNAAAGMILGAGGGASSFFTQPPWQSGIAPNDGFRHVPDISLNSSVYQTPYYVLCSSIQCFGSGYYGGIEYLGGTSLAAPTMAGVVALLNQYLKTSGLGNINPTLYALSQTVPSAFHDITVGNNQVPCAYGSPNCPASGIQGYAAGTGYDSASGLGSVDVTNLIQNWHTAAPTGAVLVSSIDQNPVTQGVLESCGNSSQWNFQLTLSEEAGFGATLSSFSINGSDLSSKISSIFGTASIGARQAITGCYTLSGVSVPATETFTFGGVDANGNQWSTSMSVPFQGPLASLSVTAATNAASYQKAFAPGMLMALFGTGLGTAAQSASTIPLPEFMGGFQAYINNYPVPLMYVGPGQVNLQIPYEVSGSAQLLLYTPYVPNGITFNFSVSSSAPGIFTLLDGSSLIANGVSTSGSAGQASTIYITGDGRVTPTVPDGTSPAVAGTSTPKPRATVSVSVGGVTASTTDGVWYAAVPSWSVGVTQINFTIPAGVAKGKQPVVVTVGGVSSPAAYINIQ